MAKDGKITFEADGYKTQKWSGKAEDAGDQTRIETNPGKKEQISGQATKVNNPS
jgi:hypothetical protein